MSCCWRCLLFLVVVVVVVVGAPEHSLRLQTAEYLSHAPNFQRKIYATVSELHAALHKCPD